MNPILRGSLVICALLMLVFVTRKLRKSQFDTADSLFWLFMSACLLVVSIFPNIAYFFSSLLGIQSPSNFIFLAVIALLLVREFSIQIELSQLRRKLTILAQEIALRNDLPVDNAPSKDGEHR